MLSGTRASLLTSILIGSFFVQAMDTKKDSLCKMSQTLTVLIEDLHIEADGGSSSYNFYPDLEAVAEMHVNHSVYLEPTIDYDEQLIAATQSSDAQKVREALDAGASLRTRDSSGRTVFHIAAVRDGEILSLLIQYAWQRRDDVKAIINLENEEGNTPLHDAVKNEIVETVKILVKEGADVTKCNKQGQSPLRILSNANQLSSKLKLPGGEASDKERQEIKECLEKHSSTWSNLWNLFG